jgi:hypothetical protein
MSTVGNSIYMEAVPILRGDNRFELCMNVVIARLRINKMEAPCQPPHVGIDGKHWTVE